MGKEIERKFLVKSDDYKRLAKGTLYRQGYLSVRKEAVVRVRIIDDKGFITIKSKNIGAIRAEYEYEVPYSDACEMLDSLCEKPIVEKYRYKLEFKGAVWEIDEFLGDNEGLVMAEIELINENDDFQKPEWIGEEVTKDPRYYNSNLAKNSYKNWRKDV